MFRLPCSHDKRRDNFDFPHYAWTKVRGKVSGMDASMMARLKELEDENRRLKKMYAEERLKAEIVQEALAKKW